MPCGPTAPMTSSCHANEGGWLPKESKIATYAAELLPLVVTTSATRYCVPLCHGPRQFKPRASCDHVVPFESDGWLLAFVSFATHVDASLSTTSLGAYVV